MPCGSGQLLVAVAIPGTALVGQPAADGTAPDALAHGLADLAQEPQPVLERATVGVGAGVGVRGEELGGQVVEARADLDAVDAAGRRVGGRLAVAVDHLADLAPSQLARLGLETGAGDAGGRHGSRARGRGDHLAPAVEELHEQARVVLVNGLGQAPVCGHDLREISTQRVRGQQAGVVDRGGLDDDQPGAAAGARPVVGDQLVGGQVVVDEAGLVRGRDDPVWDRDAADCQRREQAVEHAATVAAGRARTVSLTATVAALPPAAPTVR